MTGIPTVTITRDEHHLHITSNMTDGRLQLLLLVEGIQQMLVVSLEQAPGNRPSALVLPSTARMA